MTHWNESTPIYRQLADQLAAAMLDGDPPEGEALPSVRTLASQYLINPLTVGRALQALADEGLVESRRGLGMYVLAGAQAKRRSAEREYFLNQEWPKLRERLRRLGLSQHDLSWGAQYD